MGRQLHLGGGPERRPLGLPPHQLLPHLLGAGVIQFFQPADLPLLENQFQVNTFIQATQTDGLQLLHRPLPVERY